MRTGKGSNRCALVPKTGIMHLPQIWIICCALGYLEQPQVANKLYNRSFTDENEEPVYPPYWALKTTRRNMKITDMNLCEMIPFRHGPTECGSLYIKLNAQMGIAAYNTWKIMSKGRSVLESVSVMTSNLCNTLLPESECKT